MEGILDNYKRIYQLLEDEQSRDIYLNKLNWLISGDLKYIEAILTAYLPEVPLIGRKTVSDLKKEIPRDRKVVLYGAGTLGRMALSNWRDDERFLGFCSHTKEKQLNGYCGYPVMSPEELLSRRDLSVIISTNRSNEEIRQILRDRKYPKDQIYSLNEYSWYEDPGQYFAPEFMTYGDDEVFIDVGCYDLNSSLQLCKYCGRPKKIYAFEPDPESYAVCFEKKERFNFKEVELLPVGAWSRQTELYFRAQNNGASTVCPEGEIRVPVVAIDDVIDPADQVTMIKMDIEGSELEALKGAQKTIQRDRPKLAICIYHKPMDMVEIPLYIKELVPEYKLYVRHHSNSHGETVLYAVPT